MPDTVRYAFYLMLGGAALQVLGILGSLVQVGEIRDQVREQLSDEPGTTQSTIDAAVTTAVVFIIIVGLIGAGLWIWMAYANKAGKNWARITGTVFFGIATLGTLFTIASASSSSAMAGNSTGLSTAITIINWLVGLATVILLWHTRSSAHFKPQAEYGYGYQPPGQTYPPSGPAPGQTYPPQGGQQPPPPQQPPAGPPPPGGPGNMPPPQ